MTSASILRALMLLLITWFVMPLEGIAQVSSAAPGASTRTLTVAPGQQGGRRVALVIGNDSYQRVDPLKNARADARAMAKALEDSGFDVLLRLDASEKQMKEVLRQFKGRVSGGDEAVFFFSGHGVQLGPANYLLPVDIQNQNEDQVRDDAVPLQRVLDDLQDQRAKFSLAIIDACRNNPFKGAGRSIGGRGLAPTSAATGQMVLYSAGAGQQALDRLGDTDRHPNGLFTRIFLREMAKPGVPVDRVLRSVREEVVRLARSVGHEQVPALYDQTLGEFYFRPAAGERPAAQVALTSPAPAPAVSAALPAPAGNSLPAGTAAANIPPSTPATTGSVERPAGYPSRPLRLVVPFAAGGLTDTLARLLAQMLSPRLGQPVIVENRPGAGGMLATEQVARGAADGYTLLMGTPASTVVLPLVSTTPVDPLRELQAVASLGESLLVLAVPATAPYMSVAGLIEAARRRPGQLTYASSGAASSGHLAALALQVPAGASFVHVPYKGSGPALADLIGGRIDFGFFDAAMVVPQQQSGTMRPLAIAGTRRHPLLPDVPTLAEAGLAGDYPGNWFAIFAPAGTSPKTVAYLAGEIGRLTADTEFRQRVSSFGVLPAAIPAGDLSGYMRQESSRVEQLVRAVRLRLD